MKHVFFSVGEVSGDLHAGRVAQQLQDMRLTGIAGDHLIAAGVNPLYHIRDTAVMGFVEVALNYRKLRRIFDNTCAFLEKERPDLLVCVDYAGFNLRLCTHAKRLGIPVLFYIAPKVWAWGEGRVKTMAKVIDRLAVIFPFEKEFFASRGIRADYVGNPNAETPFPPIDREGFLKQFGLAANARLLGILPGSRGQEVRRMLPRLIEGAERLIRAGRFDACLVSRAPHLDPALFKRIENRSEFRRVDANAGPVFALSDFLFVKSGTATLEAALHLKPFLTVYRANPITFFVGRRIVKIKDVSMANLVCGKHVVPELMQAGLTPDSLVRETEAILDTPGHAQAMVETFRAMKAGLETPKASLATANLIKEMLHG